MRVLPFLAALLAVGCAAKTDTPETPTTASTAAPASSGGVAPMAGGAAGGLSPVSGGESVDGAGMGGVGSAAKDMARRAAGTPTAPSAPADGE